MKIAVIGTGLIGRSWSMVFARAGLDVSIWDAHPPAAEAALDFIGRRLPELAELGLLHNRTPETVLAAIKPAASLADCLDGATHVQENGPERVADKIALFAELDRLAAPETVLASSTTAIRASAFTEALPGPWPLPGRPSGQPALSHSAGRAQPRALDDARDRCADSGADGAGGHGAGGAEARDRRLHPHRLQAALIAEAMSLVRNRHRRALGYRRHGEAWSGPALVLHGSLRDHRPQRPRRPARLRRPLRPRLQRHDGAFDHAELVGRPDRAPARGPPKAVPEAEHKARQDGATGA